MSLEKIVSDIKRYASGLGEELGSNYDIAFCKGPRALKRYRFSLMSKFMDKAPKGVVIRYLQDKIDAAGEILLKLSEEEDRLLKLRSKIQRKQRMREPDAIDSDSDSDNC